MAAVGGVFPLASLESLVDFETFLALHSSHIVTITTFFFVLVLSVWLRQRWRSSSALPVPLPLPTFPLHAEPVRLASKLLASRDFVRDMARLAEHIMMNDVPEDFWSFDEAAPSAADELKLRLRCREQAPFFAPDKVGDVAEKPASEANSCHVRWQRASWCIKFKQLYRPHVADWIDTGVATEKPACVLLLKPIDGEPPIVAVAFRGSKTLQDYARTDISPSFIPVPCGDLGEQLNLIGGAPASTDEEERQDEGDEDASEAALLSQRASREEAAHSPLQPTASHKSETDLESARLMPFLAGSSAPCVTLGVWKAYAGEESNSYDGSNPRARVRRAVERLLRSYPTARVVLAGHSLGGALATLCAFDLLAQSESVRSAGPMTLVNFAAPRMFNQAFQDAMRALAASGRLHALRVVVGPDMIARVPPKQLGSAHGIGPRLLLHPADLSNPASYSVRR